MPNYQGQIRNLVVGDGKKVRRTVYAMPAGTTISKAWLTFKSQESDTAFVLQKVITPVDVPTEGQVTDTGADGTGAVYFNCRPVDTALFSANTTYYYDLQLLLSDGDIQTPEKGTVRPRAQITTATA